MIRVTTAQARLSGLLALALWACAPGGQGPEEAEGDSGEMLPAPVFLEPAGGELVVPTTRTRDLTFDVAHVDPGATLVVLDDERLGTLAADGPVGQLGTDKLVLHLRGALVPGSHQLVLAQGTSLDAPSSEPVTLTVEPAAGPTLSWSLGEPFAQGELRLGQAHQAAQNLLWAVQWGENGARVLLWPWDGETWRTANRHEAMLPGYVDPARVGPPAVTVAPVTFGDSTGWRVAWRVGDPGRRIDLIELSGDAAAAPEPVVTSPMVPGLDWVGPVEWMEVDRPVLLGERLFAELWAPVDVEFPHPGDHTVAMVMLGSDVTRATPVRLPLGPVDVDQLGPTSLALEPLAPWSLSARFGRQGLGVLDLEESGLVLPRTDPTGEAGADEQTWTDLAFAPIRLDGALGSHIALGLTPPDEAGQQLVLVYRGSNFGAIRPRVARAKLPTGATVTGMPAWMVLGGAAIALLPRGEQDVLAITLSENVSVVPLAGLACDEVATPQIVRDEGYDALPVACLRDGVLRIGQIRSAT